MESKNLLKEARDALAKESELKSCVADIYILVNDGTVILAGSVKSDSLKNLAIRLISEIPGVNLLIEDLKVEAKKSDTGIQIDFGRREAWHYPVI
ncbi:MAG: BON domain-containing protein [Chryseosolibacter sp.]